VDISPSTIPAVRLFVQFSLLGTVLSKWLGFEEGLPFPVDDKRSELCFVDMTVIRRESFAGF
jgi:hypothetical protein